MSLRYTTSQHSSRFPFPCDRLHLLNRRLHNLQRRLGRPKRAVNRHGPRLPRPQPRQLRLGRKRVAQQRIGRQEAVVRETRVAASDGQTATAGPSTTPRAVIISSNGSRRAIRIEMHQMTPMGRSSMRCERQAAIGSLDSGEPIAKGSEANWASCRPMATSQNEHVRESRGDPLGCNFVSLKAPTKLPPVKEHAPTDRWRVLLRLDDSAIAWWIPNQ